jgi:putative lipoprotein
MKALIWIAAVSAAAALAGCGQTGAKNVAANASANATAPEKPKHPTYCFYKDANAKGWKAVAGKDGNVTVKGKAYLEDSGYRGDLVQGEVEGDKATIWLTMAPNDTGYAKPDGWWDVSASIPGSSAVTSVTVMCAKKTVATLTVKR